MSFLMRGVLPPLCHYAFVAESLVKLRDSRNPRLLLIFIGLEYSILSHLLCLDNLQNSLHGDQPTTKHLPTDDSTDKRIRLVYLNAPGWHRLAIPVLEVSKRQSTDILDCRSFTLSCIVV
jgi:hypothetical protein